VRLARCLIIGTELRLAALAVATVPPSAAASAAAPAMLAIAAWLARAFSRLVVRLVHLGVPTHWLDGVVCHMHHRMFRYGLVRE
jgi:mannose/fructose/N-acetylgalactosamine-specific phosphotransferase system component IIC